MKPKVSILLAVACMAFPHNSIFAQSKGKSVQIGVKKRKSIADNLILITKNDRKFSKWAEFIFKDDYTVLIVSKFCEGRYIGKYKIDISDVSFPVIYEPNGDRNNPYVLYCRAFSGKYLYWTSGLSTDKEDEAVICRTDDEGLLKQVQTGLQEIKSLIK